MCKRDNFYLSTRKNYVVLIVVAFLVSCTNWSDNPAGVTSDNTEHPVRAGQFGLSLLKGLEQSAAKTQVQVDSAPLAQFDLGQIRSSNAYYFLLYNIGDCPITDISITSNNDHFIVSPQNMDSLMPGENVAMRPIIKVSVVHGTAIEGIGYRTCLAAGQNTASLTIAGKTKTGEEKDTSIALAIELKIEALVVSFDLQIKCLSISLESPLSWTSSVSLLNGSKGNPVPSYGIDASCSRHTSGKWAKINNKSNVPIIVTAYYYKDLEAGALVGPISETLGVDESVFINRAIHNQNCFTVCVDGNHTTNNFDVLRPQNDGRTYFNIWHTEISDTHLDCPPELTSKVIDLATLVTDID